MRPIAVPANGAETHSGSTRCLSLRVAASFLPLRCHQPLPEPLTDVLLLTQFIYYPPTTQPHTAISSTWTSTLYLLSEGSLDRSCSSIPCSYGLDIRRTCSTTPWLEASLCTSNTGFFACRHLSRLQLSSVVCSFLSKLQMATFALSAAKTSISQFASVVRMFSAKAVLGPYSQTMTNVRCAARRPWLGQNTSA